ncbi:MAG: DUF1016 domain-containing protein [wastewater metagenome]|nr:DUF1016 domain-containing protein [Candidatus Loosdrechtia aerotolerans]
MLSGVVDLLESARKTSIRTINTIMTATYWEIGRRIVEYEQGGRGKADYGKKLIDHLAIDLTKKFGRGFGRSNLFQMRSFYLAYAAIVQTPSGQLNNKSPSQIFQTSSGIFTSMNHNQIRQTPSGESKYEFTGEPYLQTLSEKLQTVSAKSYLAALAVRFQLPWSHYIKLLGVRNADARAFYEAEALRGGWSVRQLERQISTQYYERTALSRNKAAMLKKGAKPLPEDSVTPEEEIKDPFILEFLGLKDEYSENDLEEALILKLENFLLELGGEFAFIGRQRRLRIGDEWYRVDLVFFHRRLRCLVVIDLKLGKFTHADAGQMHLYLNYAKEHWTHAGENPPVGLILCAQKDNAVAHYALEGLSNKVLAAEYRTALPDEKAIAAELERTRRILEGRAAIKTKREQGDE